MKEITRELLHKSIRDKPVEVQDKFLEVANSNIRKGSTTSQAISLANKAVEDFEDALEDNMSKKLITKSLNNERRLATFIVLEPQDFDRVTDGHGDYYDEETILDACVEFNKSLNARKGSLYHMVDTEGYSFVESYVTLADMIVENQVIRKGTWIQTIFAASDWIWNGIKDGTFNGLSVECIGTVEDV